ncbi:hypothetical protein [Bacillus aerolatus]|uniref:hypothetical protein n=1 Tax=Bacillus aerolatus TaxID=2653354 RepID=UPI001782914A|nr:hypothetical protein [Bacillus aerolatus]
MAMTFFYLATSGFFYFLFIKPTFSSNSAKNEKELLYIEETSLKNKAAKSNA